MKKMFFLTCLSVFMSLLCVTGAYAQDTGFDAAVTESVAQAASDTSGDSAAGAAENSEAQVLDPANIPSLVFTYWEHEAIREAQNSRGVARAPTESELYRELGQGVVPEEERVKPPPEERYISLGGIVYTAPKDWVIWLNGKRITPDAVPEEIIDLQVFKQYIQVKWYDAYHNKIFPIRLRPHQRFNIDTRIFLPGS